MTDHPETSAQRVARAESELVDLEVRSPRLPDDVNEMCIVVAEMGGSQWRSTARYVIDRIRAQAAEVERLREEMALRQHLYDAHPGPAEEELAALRARVAEYEKHAHNEGGTTP
jgi:hypothetical protein